MLLYFYLNYFIFLKLFFKNYILLKIIILKIFYFFLFLCYRLKYTKNLKLIKLVFSYILMFY